MYKKIILIILTIVTIAGCDLFKKSGNGSTDSGIAVELKSKPVSQNADTTAYFRFGASKDKLNEEDFLYSYTLYEVSGTSAAILYSYPESGNGGPNREAEFKKLKNGKQYIFKLKAYNPENESYSKEISYEFQVKYNYEFSYGIVTDSETDIYGESAGIVKNGQTFKVYATLINKDESAEETLLKSTNVSLKIDISGFDGAVLSSTYSEEQSFEVNSTTGAIWEITAPDSSTAGSIKIEIVETPYYSVSNVPVISSDVSFSAESRTPGTVTLSGFTGASDTAVLGSSFTFTAVIKNSGDTTVILSSMGITAEDSSGNDLSSQWTTSDTVTGIVIPGNSTVTKTISYMVSSSGDLGDAYITFNCNGYESVSKESVSLQSDQVNVFVTSQ